MDLISKKEIDEILLELLEKNLNEKKYEEASLILQILKEIQKLENRNITPYPLYREKGNSHDDWWKNHPIGSLERAIFDVDKQEQN